MAESSATGTQSVESLPELMTEFMVDMKCEGCVKNVKRNLEPLEGVSRVETDLAAKVVRVLGSSPLTALEASLEKTGLKHRLIGQGNPEKLALTAAVAEFKGPQVHGVVRFVQVSQESARVEAQFDGLNPNAHHPWSINEYGDLTRGADSTGVCYNAGKEGGAQDTPPLGFLGSLSSDAKGHAEHSSAKEGLQVWDLIGRSVVVYAAAPGGSSDSAHGEVVTRQRLAAAVIARSAGVGENYKSLCSCDGTVIWEATNSDYVQQK